LLSGDSVRSLPSPTTIPFHFILHPTAALDVKHLQQASSQQHTQSGRTEGSLCVLHDLRTGPILLAARGSGGIQESKDGGKINLWTHVQHTRQLALRLGHPRVFTTLTTFHDPHDLTAEIRQ
ncbi:hypothetical protein B0H10DRAFT_2097995, partial [Mycena sp. CBHHK59/15]